MRASGKPRVNTSKETIVRSRAAIECQVPTLVVPLKVTPQTLRDLVAYAKKQEKHFLFDFVALVDPQSILAFWSYASKRPDR